MDFKLVVAVYAAIVSTFVAIWRIYEYFEEKKGKIIIDPIISSTRKILDSSSGLTVQIINQGKKNRTIFLPGISGDDKTEMHVFDVFCEIDNELINDKKFPLTLQSGELYSYTFPLVYLEKLKEKGVKCLKVSVVDSFKKIYYSRLMEL